MDRRRSAHRHCRAQGSGHDRRQRHDRQHERHHPGGPNRDQEIENIIKSTQAAGKAGLPCIEYNFYAHRITEGYEEELGRAGSGLTRFNYERVKDLPLFRAKARTRWKISQAGRVIS